MVNSALRALVKTSMTVTRLVSFGGTAATLMACLGIGAQNAPFVSGNSSKASVHRDDKRSNPPNNLQSRFAKRGEGTDTRGHQREIHRVGPPMIPVGLDALRMWERWPYLRIGGRTYMRSTYDRAGGNEAADASHFLYQLADNSN